MTHRLLLSLLATLCALAASAIDMNMVRFHNEATDTTRIVEILTAVKARQLPTSGDVVAAVGRMLLDTPYVGHTLEAAEGEPEMLTVNLDELDCTTFVETCMAMALTIEENRTSWRDYIHNLERIRYRGGKINGYPSRLHYIADWIVDNSFRGNAIDATKIFPKVNYVVKSIDFMTAHRDKYTALTDSSNFERIKGIESGYRNHRFPYIKTNDLNDKQTKAAFHNGDVVGLTSTLKDLDITHMGIIVIENSEPYLMHASSSGGKVMISQKPLADFMRLNRQFTGLRVIRLKEH